MYPALTLPPNPPAEIRTVKTIAEDSLLFNFRYSLSGEKQITNGSLGDIVISSEHSCNDDVVKDITDIIAPGLEKIGISQQSAEKIVYAIWDYYISIRQIYDSAIGYRLKIGKYDDVLFTIGPSQDNSYIITVYITK